MVAGQLLPREIATQAQRVFLAYSHMDRRGFEPARFGPGWHPSTYWPVDSWRVGSGGNLAVRSDTFERIGGFPPFLGLGTPARGGEDLFFTWSVLRQGGTAVYRPDAVAWHRHHGTMEALLQVMFGYGAGHAAYLRAARRNGAPLGKVLPYRLSYWYDRIVRLGKSLLGLAPYPVSLVLRELSGSLAGGSLGRRSAEELGEGSR
jgi:GT2 family glycosyltransferase